MKLPSTKRITLTHLSWIFGALGAVLSWTVNQSFWWAFFHWIVCGIYIPYWLIVYSPLCRLIQEWIS